LRFGAFQLPTFQGRQWLLAGRVVAIPGETIETRSGRLLVNGTPADSSGSRSETTTTRAKTARSKAQLLAGDEWLVLQDSAPPRGNVVRRHEILGQVFQRYWPAKDFGFLEDVERSGGVRGIALGIGAIVFSYLVMMAAARRFRAP
jgi:hypothetical protein